MAAILVVDDEPGIREFMLDTLSTDGHAITQAADGTEALEHLRHHSYDLLITDLRMPGGLDGIGLLKEARSAHPEMKVIVLTAHATVGSAVDAMKHGAHDYLEKPISGPTELRILVSRALEPRYGNGARSVADPIQQVALDVASALGLDYEVAGTLGRGGYAMVFSVHDKRLNRHLAVKALLPEFAAAADTAARFRREAQTVARLSHPNIVPVYFVGRERDVPCFVMPFIAGESLAQLLARNGRIALPLVLRIARDIAAALDFAHQAGVIHRDVKPENVLLEASTSRSLLTDFGIAKALTPPAEAEGTGPGVFVGTPRYVSPEQATGEHDVDARSDVYSLGVVVYEMIAGKPPFAGSSALKILGQHVSARVPLLHKRVPGVNKQIDAVIARALSKDPAARFATAGAFVFALQVAAALGNGKS